MPEEAEDGRMKAVSLSQAELDDAYHLAYFECEDAAIKAVKRILVFDQDRGTRDVLINRISDDLHEVEMKHLGPERYSALMSRLRQRSASQPEASPQ
jgi:hypothetical protein